MKHTLIEKLKAYSLTAGALAGGVAGQSQVLYTDVDPDSTVSGNGNSYNLDLNNDNVVDFSIEIFSTTNVGSYTWSSGWWNYSFQTNGVRITPQGTGNAVLGWAALALDEGAPVMNQFYGWNSYGPAALAQQQVYAISYYFNTYYGTQSGSFSGTYAGGNFMNAQNKYAGLRLDVAGDTFYGWVRLDVPSLSQFVVKDYAIEQTADHFILTGDTGIALYASVATQVTAADINNNGNGSDIEVTFNAGANEGTVLLYKVIAVKEANAGSFDLAAAQAVGSGEFLAVLPTGAGTYTETLIGGMRDSDGDEITVNVPYKIFVQTVANSSTAQNDVLSSPSDTVVLETMITLEPVQFVSIYDVANNGNGLDLEVNFNPISNEANLDEYRIFIVKSAAAGGFGLTAAQSNTNYLPVAPNGMIVNTVLTSSSKDTDGDLIVNNVPYRAFVMSVADGINAFNDYLSPMSNPLTLANAVGVKDHEEAGDKPKVLTRPGVLVVVAAKDKPIEHFELFSIDGKRMVERHYAQREISLTREEFPAGMYLAKVVTATDEHYLKLILR